MKIKKIQWGNKVIWNDCERYFKQLPFNMTALVREMVLEFYAWSIRQGTKVIASGKADTMNEAKAACEDAWESIVMEALEEEMVCT
jgi:hypothetical protein